MDNQGAGGLTAESGWRGLYLVGGVAALLAALVFRRNWSAEYWLLKMLGVIDFGPATPPITAGEWFAVLQNSGLLGVILLDFADLINCALVGLVYLALYGALRRTNRRAMAIATVSGLIGIGVAFASNQAFSLLSLSEQHAAATTEAQQAIFLAAGEALLAFNNPGVPLQGSGLYLSLFLVTLAGLIISIVMLRSPLFSRATAWVGILAHGFGLGYFIALAFAPGLLALPPSLAAPLLLVWNILTGVRLLKLGPRFPNKTGSASLP